VLSFRFYQGGLDNLCMDKCKALDPSFEFDHLRFMREDALKSMLDCPGVPESELAEASRQKMLADFALFEAELKSEQQAWSSYMAKLSEVEDSELGGRVALQEQRQAMLTRAVGEHHAWCYRTVCLPQWSGAPTFLEASLASFASQRPGCTTEQVWRINVVNAACLGVQASLVLQHLANALSADHTSHPERTLSVIILPNTPEWGWGPWDRAPAQLRTMSFAFASLQHLSAN